MLDRPGPIRNLQKALSRSPITALLGPRQCGKATLARPLAGEAPFFDLERPVDRQRLQNPELALTGLEGLVVLDEVQAMPELFPVLRALVDRPDASLRFLLLGSASPHLVRHASETLAGRVEFVELGGFSLQETGYGALDRLWLRGGFPRSFLAQDEEDSFAWREGFVRTFLERDIPSLGFRIAPAAMRRFWTMLAHYHGQTWNASVLGRAMGLSDKVMRGYLDILAGTYMVRQLRPWFENVGKRQVKAPKVYFRDTGLLHHLLGLQDRLQVLGHPKAGASWEGFAIERVLDLLHPAEAYFWSVHNGAEVDLVVFQGGRRLGFEMKFTETPHLTASMIHAREDLGLDHLWVVHPGAHAFPLHEGISAAPLRDLAAALGSAPQA